MICDNLSNVVQYVQSGTLKAISVTAKERSPQLPNVPTSQEAGYPDLEAGIGTASLHRRARRKKLSRSSTMHSSKRCATLPLFHGWKVWE